MIVSKTRTCEMLWGTMDSNEDELDIPGYGGGNGVIRSIPAPGV